MVRQQQFIFASFVTILAILACQSSANPIPNLGTEPTQPLEISPTSEVPTATAGTDNGSVLKIPPSFLADPNTACAITNNGYDDGLSCLDGNGWHIYENSAFNPPYIPDAISHCPDGRTYISSGNEIYQIKGKTSVDLGNGGGADPIACGSANEIWTSDLMGGVMHFDGTTWTRYPATEIFGTSGGDGSKLIYSMAVAPNGDVWATTDKNIAIFDGTGWKILTPPGNNSYLESYDQRRGLVVDTKGNVWAVAQNDGHDQLLKYDGIQWSTFPSPENDIRFIVLDHENRVWAAAFNNQISTLDTQTKSWVLQFGTRQFGAGGPFALNVMRFDGQDRLWVATDYGLDIFDGSTWTTYHMHTADLYANNINDVTIFGDGPQLPALEQKAPGSVRGRLVGQNPTVFSTAQVELCLKPETGQPSGKTPCADQAYHVLTTVGADGNFVFTDIPAGRYYLMGKVSSSWGSMVNSGLSQLPSDKAAEFEVNPGAETQLGEIGTSP